MIKIFTDFKSLMIGDTLRMNKIKRVSLFFRIIFQLGFILMPVMLAQAWINSPTPTTYCSYLTGLYFNFIPSHLDVLQPLTTSTRILGFCLSLLPLSIELFIVYCLIKLFRFFEKGEIFSLKNVHCIRNIGYTLLVSQVINPFYQLLMTYIVTWYNPLHEGKHYIEFQIGAYNANVLLTGFLIILISWIMAEGSVLAEEQQQIL